MFIKNAIFKIKKLGINYYKNQIIKSKSVNFNKNFDKFNKFNKFNKVKNNLNKNNIDNNYKFKNTIFYSGNEIKKYDHFGYDFDLNSNDYLLKKKNP